MTKTIKTFEKTLNKNFILLCTNCPAAIMEGRKFNETQKLNAHCCFY